MSTGDWKINYMSQEENSIFEFQLNVSEKFKIVESEFNGVKYYHLRTYVRSKFSGQEEQYFPTKKGLAFTVNELPKFFMSVLALKNYVEKKTNDISQS